MLEVLDQHQAGSRTVLSLAGGALTAHLDPSYRMGRPVIKNKAVRALLIAAAGCMAVIALVYGVFTYTDVNKLIGDLVWHPATPKATSPWCSPRISACWPPWRAVSPIPRSSP
jgi:hypothetical protein